MTTPEKKSLFTAVTEEESTTVCGGFSLYIQFDNPQIYSDPSAFLAAAAAKNIDLNDLKQKLALADSGSQQ